MSANIDIWALFIALLVTALLQEFFIKPGVEFLKVYYHKSRFYVEKQIGQMVGSNGFKKSQGPMMIRVETKETMDGSGFGQMRLLRKTKEGGLMLLASAVLDAECCAEMLELDGDYKRIGFRKWFWRWRK